MKTSELFQALEEGKTLIKDFAIFYHLYQSHYEVGKCLQKMSIDIDDGSFSLRGWGSVTGPDTAIIDIVKNPQDWYIEDEK